MYSFKNKFDSKIIKYFRDNIVNDPENFTRQYYQSFNNNRGKVEDRWSKICSCVDWIQAAIYELQKDITFSKTHVSMEFLHLIVTLDALSRGIQELWRSFGLQYPLEKNCNIFNKNVLWQNKTDDKYFEELRAFFGVHAVNGHELTLKLPKKDSKIRARFFSSYTTKVGDYFETSMYSNNDEVEEIYGGPLKVNINELINYAVVRYESIKDLEKEIKNTYEKIQKKIIRNMQTIIDLNICDVDKISKLREYAKKNYKEDVYSDEIDLYLNFKTINLDSFSDEDKTEIISYLSILDKNVLPVYIDGLSQKSEYNAMGFFYPEGKSRWYAEHNYALGKILTSNNILYSEILFDELIEKHALPKYVKQLSNNELTLLIKSKAYYDPNKIKKNDLISMDDINEYMENILKKNKKSKILKYIKKKFNFLDHSK